MPFGMNIGSLNALRTRSADTMFNSGAGSLTQQLNSSGLLDVDPSQNPNFAGGDPLQDFEAFGVNELFDTRNDQASDTFRSLSRVGNRVDQKKQVAQARNEAGQASDVAEGIFQRRTEGMGLTGRQKRGARQSFSLNRAVTQAGAATDTRRNIANQSRAADRAVTGFEDIAFGQQLGALSGLANAEGQRQVRLANDRASKKSNRNSLLGTLGGLALGVASLFSAEEYKDKVEEKPRLLDKLKTVRVDKWRYKGSKAEHIGPYAEEFNETFGVGRHRDAIDVVDLLGVTIGSLKELNEKVERALG